MSSFQEIDEADGRLPSEERTTFRTWYAEFDAAKVNDRPFEGCATFRDWFAEFDAARWDRQLETDVAAGRLDWLIAEARNDRHEGRCTDR